MINVLLGMKVPTRAQISTNPALSEEYRHWLALPMTRIVLANLLRETLFQSAEAFQGQTPSSHSVTVGTLQGMTIAMGILTSMDKAAPTEEIQEPDFGAVELARSLGLTDKQIKEAQTEEDT
jgi:hypothetical protein